MTSTANQIYGLQAALVIVDEERARTDRGCAAGQHDEREVFRRLTRVHNSLRCAMSAARAEAEAQHLASCVPDLVWTQNVRGETWTAQTIVGEYSVGFDDGWWAELVGPESWEWAPEENPRSFLGPDAGMRAAQEDYAHRILGALLSACVEHLARFKT